MHEHWLNGKEDKVEEALAVRGARMYVAGAVLWCLAADLVNSKTVTLDVMGDSR